MLFPFTEISVCILCVFLSLYTKIEKLVKKEDLLSPLLIAVLEFEMLFALISDGDI